MKKSKNNIIEKHSFIILAFKNSPYLEECIRSLKDQTLKSRIYIATSTPSVFLETIAEKYEIDLLVNSNSKCISSDWSFAYENCRTEFLTLAHQDDVYLPNYTEKCLSQVKKYPNGKNLIIFTKYSELINGKIRNYTPNLLIKDILLLPFYLKNNICSPFIKRSVLSLGNPISCPSVTYNRNSLGNFKFSNDFVCNMDWDAWLRLSILEGNFIYIKKRLVLHRINNDSQTTKQIKERIRHKEDLLIFCRLWPKPLAFFVANLYSLATKFNKTR